MPEWGSSGSVRGVRSDAHPYRDRRKTREQFSSFSLCLRVSSERSERVVNLSEEE